MPEGTTEAALNAPVVVVDDEPDNLDAFLFTFKKVFHIETARSGEEALARLAAVDAAVLVCDQRMPGMVGLEVLRRAHELRPDVVGILLTAYADFDVLVDAINGGYVYRYVQKPWDSKELRVILQQAIERWRLVRENRRLAELLAARNRYFSDEIGAQFDFGEIIGESDVLRSVLDQVARVAPTGSTVLLRGESGTGKELVARAIHMNSARIEKPFVRVNCAALAPGVLESELFGHEKGSFTGALAKKIGRFELADGGTIFLDEVGDLPVETQIKLLRVLQEREFERVGGTDTIQVDVRVISATNRDLERLISESRFREDLYYRLNVFPIVIPPLRDRPGDIPILAAHFAEKLARRAGKGRVAIDPGVYARLAAYSWPGNVRELENVIERALILCEGAVVAVADLAFGGRGIAVAAAVPPSPATASVAVAFVPPAAPAPGDAVLPVPATVSGVAAGRSPVGVGFDTVPSGDAPATLSLRVPLTLLAASGAPPGAPLAGVSAAAPAVGGASPPSARLPAGAGAGAPASVPPSVMPARPSVSSGPSAGGPRGDAGLDAELEEVERTRLVAAIEKHQGRKSDAARELGINRSTLYYRLKKYGLE
ncbi:MAG TPA: sigma 54-interacting transcriptional regulator [Myxococcota bacterium]|jgi:DNA-binding NtrC family response regulator|nr:sigma 54-interacting transcriptional regulator [Myxococcota bacterium]